MFRSSLISWAGHVGLFVIIGILAVIRPPIAARKPMIRVRLIEASRPLEDEPKETQRFIATPEPEIEPSPEPAPPNLATPKPKIEKPKPTPIEPKKRIENKEIVQKDPEILTPTPEPTPIVTPRPTVARTPRATPTATPYRTPRATPTRKPTPRPTRRVTPRPTPPRVNLPPRPAIASTAQVTASESFQELGEAYISIALMHIQQNFKPPRSRPGMKCVVRFKIMKDGELRDERIVRSTGRTELDQTALKALKETARLPPLYENFAQPYKDVQITFNFEKR